MRITKQGKGWVALILGFGILIHSLELQILSTNLWFIFIIMAVVISVSFDYYYSEPKTD